MVAMTPSPPPILAADVDVEEGGPSLFPKVIFQRFRFLESLPDTGHSSSKPLQQEEVGSRSILSSAAVPGVLL